MDQWSSSPGRQPERKDWGGEDREESEEVRRRRRQIRSTDPQEDSSESQEKRAICEGFTLYGGDRVPDWGRGVQGVRSPERVGIDERTREGEV